MITNPRIELWEGLLNRFIDELGPKKTIDLFKSGKILLKDLDDSHVSFICENSKDRKVYTREYYVIISNILKKVKPSLTSWEVKISNSTSSRIFSI